MLSIHDDDEGTVSVMEGQRPIWKAFYHTDNHASQKVAHFAAHAFKDGAKWQQAKSIGAPKVNSAGVPVFEGGQE